MDILIQVVTGKLAVFRPNTALHEILKPPSFTAKVSELSGKRAESGSTLSLHNATLYIFKPTFLMSKKIDLALFLTTDTMQEKMIAVIAVTNIQCCKILSHNIANHCIMFWHLMSLV